MSLARGIQSAIFYYLSCKPYFDARHRRKAKKQAAADREQNEILYKQMPHLYRHPEPNTTNPAWQVEIEMGPTPSMGKGKRKQPSSEAKSRGGASVNASQAVSAVSLPVLLEQGEHEVVQPPPKAKLASRKRDFEPTSNPAINDLHPPTVRKVRTRDELAWMFEPPPPMNKG
ncbi:hypothetical protein BAUCODRAFT_144405 [Baudoinia panamericana UAMH 10762]|uniref:Uncharacterized protein n=1 Tax=Baudoinia panamericana (strain UAMH 10762) TaxID=717646 RepID=M2NMN3_BAUPA|nr:uncharacterized protein BAUCODRAFT_144405 [Baudoinia panamericana UAMH 10762]EMD00790.1 hypothetical protein BAUCODRAFT_144405 [Baudoinia panamericana UAMH 10762]